MGDRATNFPPAGEAGGQAGTDGPHCKVALNLAARGWPVLPLCWPVFGPEGAPRCGCGCGHAGRDIGKAPIGRLVPHGYHDATTDPAVIRRWWSACPEANVGVALGPAGLLVVDCDSDEALAEALERGLPRTVIRHSRAPAFVYRRPPDCPAARRDAAPGLQLLGTGYLVVWGRHREGPNVRLEPWPPDDPAPAPGWVVNFLREKGRGPGPRPAAEGGGAEPPVRLAGRALDLWRGRLVIPKGGERPVPVTEVPPGGVDRSRTLFQIALALARAGATRSTIAAAVAERDRTLGFDKYADRRDGEVRYEEVARKAVECAEQDLPPPRPLRSDVPPFPLDALPEPLRTFVRQGADALECPPEFVAAPLLAATGALAGNRVRVAITPGWAEGPALWVAVVGNPGSGKTPAMELGLGPLRRLQAEAMRAWREELELYEAEPSASRRGRGAGGTPVRPDRPEPEHFFTTDSTLEALYRILGHPRSRTPGLLIYRDELVGWVRSFDNYRHGGERQAMLSAWAGVGFKVDRAGRDPYWVAHPVISVVGGVVPDLLSRLEEEAGVLDGFLDRFLWVWPDCAPAPLSTRSVAEQVQEEVIAACRQLRRVPEGPVPLTEGAFEVFARWHEYNRTRQQAAAGLWAGILAKLPRQLARLALCLHLWRHPERPAEPVEAVTMAAAVELVDYFAAHARRVVASFGLKALVSDPKALRVYDAIREAGPLNLRQLNDRTGLSGTELQVTLDRLVRAGLVEVARADPHGPGRPPVIVRARGEFVQKIQFVPGGSCGSSAPAPGPFRHKAPGDKLEKLDKSGGSDGGAVL